MVAGSSLRRWAQLQAKLAGGDGEAALDGARRLVAVEGEVNGRYRGHTS